MLVIIHMLSPETSVPNTTKSHLKLTANTTSRGQMQIQTVNMHLYINFLI